MGLFHPDAQVKGCAGFNLIALLCNNFSATAFSFEDILIFLTSGEIGL
jgi:hypothetical protein